MPEFESEGWLQMPHTRVKCRQCKCNFVENPDLRSSKCHRCKRQIKTTGTRLDGIVFTNVDPRYAGKLDDPQGGDTTMLMQQVKEVIMFNQIWKTNHIGSGTSKQMWFPLRLEFANENQGEEGKFEIMQ